MEKISRKFGCKMYVYTPPPQGWRGVHDGKNTTNHGVQSYYRPGPGPEGDRTLGLSHTRDGKIMPCKANALPLSYRPSCHSVSSLKTVLSGFKSSSLSRPCGAKWGREGYRYRTISGRAGLLEPGTSIDRAAECNIVSKIWSSCVCGF